MGPNRSQKIHATTVREQSGALRPGLTAPLRSRLGLNLTSGREVRMSTDLIDTIRGSGNVYRDFGYADANIRQAKAILGARII
jgi:hypothetical protein